MSVASVFSKVNHCTFCYKSIDSQQCFTEDSQKLHNFTTFLQRFCSDKSPPLNNKLLEACKPCLEIVDSFMSIYNQLKCLELQLMWKMQKLRSVMIYASRAPSRIKQFQEKCKLFDAAVGAVGGSHQDVWTLANSFRTHLVQLCSRKIKEFPPRVNLNTNPRVTTEKPDDGNIYPILSNSSEDVDMREGGSMSYDYTKLGGFSPQCMLSYAAVTFLSTLNANTYKRSSVKSSRKRTPNVTFLHNKVNKRSTFNIRTKSSVPTNFSECQGNASKKAFPEIEIKTELSEDYHDPISSIQGPHIKCETNSHGDNDSVPTILSFLETDNNCLPQEFDCLFKNQLKIVPSQNNGITVSASRPVFLRRKFKTLQKNQNLKISKPTPTRLVHNTDLVNIVQLNHDHPYCRRGSLVPNDDKRKPKTTIKREKNLITTFNTSQSQSFEYACTICGKGYISKSNLNRHQQTHRSLSNISAVMKCPHCGKVYVSRSAFSMHLLIHNRTFKCQYCEKRFSRQWLLQGHIRTHTGEKPFKCEVCGKLYADRSNLRSHTQIHSKKMPFSCYRCGKEFKVLSYLRRHKQKCKLNNKYLQ